jgi:hypothetical protein
MSVRCLKNSGATAINEINNARIISVYPNPADKYVIIRLENYTQADLSIYGLEGKLMLQRQLNQLETLIEIEDLPAGIYIVSVKSLQGIEQKRIIKTSE